MACGPELLFFGVSAVLEQKGWFSVERRKTEE
jgi:hypothetical protein